MPGSRIFDNGLSPTLATSQRSHTTDENYEYLRKAVWHSKAVLSHKQRQIQQLDALSSGAHPAREQGRFEICSWNSLLSDLRH